MSYIGVIIDSEFPCTVELFQSSSLRRPGNEEVLADKKFCYEALVPNDTWEDVEVSDVELSPRPWENVWLFQPPLKMLASLTSHIRAQEVDLEKTAGFLSGSTILAENIQSELLLPVKEWFCKEFCIHDSEIIIESLNVSTGFAFTGWHHQKQAMVGLHVDSWESTDFQSRIEKSLMRIVFNLGKSKRSFLFVNRTLPALYEAVNAREHSCSESLVLWNHFLSDSKARIFRVILPPGACYIAMTDLLVHDGIAHGDALDIHLDFRADLRNSLGSRYSD